MVHHLYTDFPKMCYHKTTSTPYLVGQTWAIQNLCILHTCKQGKDGKPYIYSKGCPERTATPPCKIHRIPNALYPQCCPYEKCPPTRVDHRRPY
ncbi:hypothetical protein C0J52_09945 [Blattella germanica]|nr:hypothetical protein C0J52_09945 [Blattella germanica]